MAKANLNSIVEGTCFTATAKTSYLHRVSGWLRTRLYGYRAGNYTKQILAPPVEENPKKQWGIYIEPRIYGDSALLVIRDGGKYVLNSTSFCNAVRVALVNRAREPIYITARKSDGTIIGVSGIMFENGRNNQVIASGFVITAREARNLGIAKALIRRSIDIAHGNGAVFVANVDETNIASCKTMESAGMRVASTCKDRRRVILKYMI